MVVGGPLSAEGRTPKAGRYMRIISVLPFTIFERHCVAL